MLNIRGGSALRRRALVAAGTVVAGGGLAIAVATASSATPIPTETLSLTNHTPISATDQQYNSGCSDLPTNLNIPRTDDIWHFVVTGGNQFQSISLTFNPGSTDVGPVYEHNKTQAYFGTTAGAVLQKASAVVVLDGTSTKNVQFVLSDTCAATSSPSPSPSPSSPSPSASPSTSPPASPSTSTSPSVSPSSSPSPSSTPPAPAPAPTPVSGNLPVTG